MAAPADSVLGTGGTDQPVYTGSHPSRDNYRTYYYSNCVSSPNEKRQALASGVTLEPYERTRQLLKLDYFCANNCKTREYFFCILDRQNFSAFLAQETETEKTSTTEEFAYTFVLYSIANKNAPRNVVP